jgi:hypothetical protein
MPLYLLKLDHCPNLGGDEWLDRIGERIGDRLDWLRLTDTAPALLQSLDGLQPPMDVGRNHRLFHTPTEQADQAAGALVNHAPTQARINHLLANGLELEGAELPNWELPEQLAKRADGEPNIANLRGRFAVLLVVTVRVVHVSNGQLVDRQVARIR